MTELIQSFPLKMFQRQVQFLVIFSVVYTNKEDAKTMQKKAIKNEETLLTDVNKALFEYNSLQYSILHWYRE